MRICLSLVQLLKDNSTLFIQCISFKVFPFEVTVKLTFAAAVLLGTYQWKAGDS